MRKEIQMKNFTKITLGALVIAGATLAATAGADARVSVGIGLGGYGPGYYGPPAYSYSCDPYSRWYDPYRCGYAPSYYGSSYYGYGGPSLVIGGRFGGGFHGGGGFHDGGGFHGGGHGGGGSHGGGHGHR
jgi:hypothetical protein